MVVCLLILVRAVRAERQVAARFDRLDWQAVHGHVRYAFDHIGRRVQAGRSDIKVRTGRTDAEAGDLVFMYCVFTTDSVDADDAVCLGVSFHPADDGRTAECLIDLSGESSGNVWVELFAGLIPASAAELIRVVQVHLSATEDVARQIDGRIDALAVEANVGGRE